MSATKDQPLKKVAFVAVNLKLGIRVDIMKRVLMIVFSYYPADARVRREAEALLPNGYAVDVICLQDQNQPARDKYNGVRIFRVPLKRKRGGKLRYMLEYFVFMVLAMLQTFLLRLQHPYLITHVHNMPDFLVYCAWFPKFLGCRIILDLHDPVPEVFTAKYNLNSRSKIIMILRMLEKYSIAFSDKVLTPNISFKEVFAARSCPAEKIEIVMNSPQEDIFSGQGAGATGKKAEHYPVVMFHGTIVERHGLGDALYAVKQLTDFYPSILLKVFGDGDFVSRFLEMRIELGLEQYVYYGGKISLEQISREIDSIDIGIIPNQRNVFTDINFPTRIFEYLIKQKPVVVPDTRGIQDYFSGEEIWFFKPGDSRNLQETIRNVLENNSGTKTKLQRAIKKYQIYTWKNEKQKLIDVYRNLLI